MAQEIEKTPREIELEYALNYAIRYLGKAVADGLLENCNTPLSRIFPKIEAIYHGTGRKNELLRNDTHSFVGGTADHHPELCDVCGKLERHVAHGEAA